jgi:DNA polymerase III sliding clamp (beta) subunit (PCNA family)
MLDSLKFVKGAVARKDPVPVLTHYRIKDGVIRGFNGLICMASPIALALDCQPKAQPFTEAIKICEELDSTPTFSMTATGRLTVKSGKFKVHIDCSPEEYPLNEPEGEPIKVEPGLVEAFKTLAPMIGQDASRPWARGILLRDGSAFATNNVVIGEYWIGYKMPFDMNVPEECIKEVLRVRKDPSAISATARSITFHYDDGRWIKSQLLTTDWPNVGPVLNKPSNATPLPPDFFDILGRIAPYAGDARKVHIRGNTLSTHTEEGIGASSLVDDDSDSSSGAGLGNGTYNIDLLRALDGLVAKIDFSLYPQPALFFGPDSTAGFPVLRGAVVGMKS